MVQLGLPMGHWRQINRLLGMALALGLDLTRRDDEHEVRQW
jgi:hypothetical protein